MPDMIVCDVCPYVLNAYMPTSVCLLAPGNSNRLHIYIYIYTHENYSAMSLSIDSYY